jgi:AbrB family looped-hinge helix DNA binding protein
MAISTRLQIRGKGALTIPAELRRKYGLAEGDVVTLIDLGEGVFLLTPTILQLDRLGDRIAQTMEAQGVTLDEILSVLDEERERYYQERYVGH